MQLMGAGEATHSCWRAAIFFVCWAAPRNATRRRGCVGCLDGCEAAATQQHPNEHGARVRLARRTQNC